MQWGSERFGKPVILTRHAVERMKSRHISPDELQVLVEYGQIKYKDEEHLWIYRAFPEREDNLLCAAAIERNNLIIKTIMTHWELSE
ncbi:MAG: DUF4258 domain-containing protein [Thiothrix sp.]|nr:DUF4258 domain-containing protein [Thiothrix sp.]HPQ97045.1 DUF4258 domain-containing protein [Thiolinea sp.]